MAEFTPFPKIARLSRRVIVTEKIDGTNAQVFIEECGEGCSDPDALLSTNGLALYSGSRKRWVYRDSDNFGFAAWCWQNADELLGLGVGRHFGEWWGQGIQRGYDVPDKRFSLFNVQRWCLYDTKPRRIETADPRVVKYQDMLPPCCGLVPVLYDGPYSQMNEYEILDELEAGGSAAAPGFMNPEGIIVYHTAANIGFKKTLKNDETPKSLA